MILSVVEFFRGLGAELGFVAACCCFWLDQLIGFPEVGFDLGLVIGYHVFSFELLISWSMFSLMLDGKEKKSYNY